MEHNVPAASRRLAGVNYFFRPAVLIVAAQLSSRCGSRTITPKDAGVTTRTCKCDAPLKMNNVAAGAEYLRQLSYIPLHRQRGGLFAIRQLMRESFEEVLGP